MGWRDLAFIHYPTEAAAIQSRLPPGLCVDTFDGRAWLALVPFRMARVAPRGTPALPIFSTFPMANPACGSSALTPLRAPPFSSAAADFTSRISPPGRSSQRAAAGSISPASVAAAPGSSAHAIARAVTRFLRSAARSSTGPLSATASTPPRHAAPSFAWKCTIRPGRCNTPTLRWTRVRSSPPLASLPRPSHRSLTSHLAWTSFRFPQRRFEQDIPRSLNNTHRFPTPSHTSPRRSPLASCPAARASARSSNRRRAS